MYDNELIEAARAGDLSQIKYYVEQGANVNVKSAKDSNKTALHLIMQTNNVSGEAVKFLLDRGADQEIKDGWGNNALYCAAFFGRKQIVELLLERGANYNSKNTDGVTPAKVARGLGYHEIADLIMARAMLNAAYNGQLETVKELVERENCSLQVSDHDGNTALLSAAYNGALEVIKWLVEVKGVSLTEKNKNGTTALLAAAYNGHLRVLKWLVEEKGVSLQTSDNHGNTALLSAAYNGALEVIKWLVEIKGVDLSERNKDGVTALLAAAYNGHLKVLQWLVEVKNVSLQEQDNNGNTALLQSTHNGQLKTVEYLLGKGADPKSKNLMGLMAIQLAEQKEFNEIANLVKSKLKEVSENNGSTSPTNVAGKEEDTISTETAIKSWYFSAHLMEQAHDLAKEKNYALIPAAPEDIGKVVTFYQHNTVPGMDLMRVEIVYNPEQNRIFSGRISLLNDRMGNKNFEPKWSKENNADWRKEMDKLCYDMSRPYTDNHYPHVKLMPLWHGTKKENLESLFKTGYANLATTDAGFFGKGIYSTHEADYADRVYSNGPLILNWVCFFSAYPVIDGDMPKLHEKANYQNYDAHFVPVIPATNNSNEVNFYPTKPSQKHKYTEVVVFESSQCLPRYLVELQPSLPKAPVNLGGNPHSLFHDTNNAFTYINLLAATHYVYDNYLSKPYTLKTNTQDWQYSHKGQTIERPNHGLAHTLRTLFYLPRVVEYYLEYNKAKFFGDNIKKLKSSINEMQLTLLFFVAARENEMGSKDNPAVYQRFREQSAKAFEEYVKHAGIKLSHEKLELYKDALLRPDFGAGHVHTILRICHDIDTMRCLGPTEYESVCNSIYPYIRKSYCDQLRVLVEMSLQKTGDRIMASNKPQNYNGDLFVSVSKDVKLCMREIKEAMTQFVMKNNNQPLSQVGFSM